MTAFKKIVTAGTVAVAMLAGTVPAIGQVEGGEEECSYNFVITGFFMSGTIPIPFWSLEKTCVRVIDENQ
ncbi:MAG TPA: hypothetical protein VGC13_02825 [Longimicrobium sp.]|jgi:hypothetical protein|uniref:hypothetical protein n=1 Tax=Longimicrobium sp. TaxID=2029185 RepID=UPI002ED8E44E